MSKAGSALSIVCCCVPPCMSVAAAVCFYSFSIFSLITYIICSDMRPQQLKRAVIKAGCGCGSGERRARSESGAGGRVPACVHASVQEMPAHRRAPGSRWHCRAVADPACGGSRRLSSAQLATLEVVVVGLLLWSLQLSAKPTRVRAAERTRPQRMGARLLLLLPLCVPGPLQPSQHP